MRIHDVSCLTVFHLNSYFNAVTTVANAIAQAVGKGDGPAVALAISRAIPKGRKNEAVDGRDDRHDTDTSVFGL